MKPFWNYRTTAAAAIVALTLISLPLLVDAQTEDVAALRQRALRLSDEIKYTEALPLFEKLVKLLPNDPEMHAQLGFSLLGQSVNTDDEAAARLLRMRARDAFIQARDAGYKTAHIQGMIEGLPEDGGTPLGYSYNMEANRLMKEGEAFFTRGQMDHALKAYADALKIDPLCYHAALFSGDVNLHRSNYPEAEKWYQKAIAIDPMTETAYRYSATPLMKQKKYDQARDRYVESFIVSPYSRLAQSGIIQWAEATGTNIGHPRIDPPEIKIGEDGKAKTTINVDPLAMDGSLAWARYTLTREVWRNGKFATQFPKERAYRHSLLEEADALRSVVAASKAMKPTKENEKIALIGKMDQDGVLEAYILMAMPDQGIARDHRSYLRSDRDKLRKYVMKYVIAAK